MTRKDYELIATTLNKIATLNDNTIQTPQMILDTVAVALATAFSNDNPRFDTLRFIEAVYKA